MAKTLLPSAMLFLPLVLILISAICKPAAPADCTPPPCQGKQTWPELLGKDQTVAYNAVKRDNPQVTDVVFLISDGADDGELCCNRVVLVIGSLPGGGEGITKVPRVG